MRMFVSIITMLCALLIMGCQPEVDVPTAEDTPPISVCYVPHHFYSEDDFIHTVYLAQYCPKQFKKLYMPDEYSHIDTYYVPTNVPHTFEFGHIYAAFDGLCRAFKLKSTERYDFNTGLRYFCYYKESLRTLENTIKGSNLVATKHSDALFFYYHTSVKRYDRAFFEHDGLLFSIMFPYDINLDSAEDIQMIEDLCQMERRSMGRAIILHLAKNLTPYALHLCLYVLVLVYMLAWRKESIYVL